MESLIDDRFMTVSTNNNSVLSLVWKKETANLSDEGFKTEALKFISIVESQKSKNILVDMRDFSYHLSKAQIAWRKKHVVSVYNRLGIKKFAFISKETAVKQDSPENTFVTKTFSSETDGLRWLTT